MLRDGNSLAGRRRPTTGASDIAKTRQYKIRYETNLMKSISIGKNSMLNAITVYINHRVILTPCKASTSLPLPSQMPMKFLKNFILTSESRISSRPTPVKVSSTGRPDATHRENAASTSRTHASIVSRSNDGKLTKDRCARFNVTTGRPPERLIKWQGHCKWCQRSMRPIIVGFHAA